MLGCPTVKPLATSVVLGVTLGTPFSSPVSLLLNFGVIGDPEMHKNLGSNLDYYNKKKEDRDRQGDVASLLVFDISLAHYLLKPFILGFTQLRLLNYITISYITMGL